MKLIIQRVKNAEVLHAKNDKVVGKIDSGLFVLVGVKRGDDLKIAEVLAEKLAKLRVMSDENGKMNLSVKDFGASILVVSQFTLYADTSGGNRPSFIDAASPDEAKRIYEHFVKRLREILPAQRQVETGSFGDYMKIKSELDGPVTIILES